MVTKQVQAEQTKMKLLEAGFSLLRAKGFSSLSAAQITKEAGLSKGGFFHHFPTIEDYYLFMLDQIIQMFTFGMVETKPATLVEFLDFSTEMALDMMDAAPEIMIAINYFVDFARFNPAYAKRLQTLTKAGLQKWTDDLAEYFPPQFPEQKRLYFTYIVDMYFAGLGTHFLVFKDKELYRAITKEFTRIIINYVNGSTK